MSGGGCSKIRYIVRLRQMLRRWRKRAAVSAVRGLPSDVPAGHIAVTVGPTCKRYVVPTTHLKHPLFQKLLLQAEEEYGFSNSGPLAIPCTEEMFEDILRCLTRSGSSNRNLTRSVSVDEFQLRCQTGFRNKLDFLADSRPLLHGVSRSSI